MQKFVLHSKYGELLEDCQAEIKYKIGLIPTPDSIIIVYQFGGLFSDTPFSIHKNPEQTIPEVENLPIRIGTKEIVLSSVFTTEFLRLIREQFKRPFILDRYIAQISQIFQMYDSEGLMQESIIFCSGEILEP